MSQTAVKPALLREATIKNLTLRNRLILAPMCQYSVHAQDGLATDWHLMHLGARAAGGFGLVMVEATAVAPQGRISPQCVGLWSDAHTAPLARIVDFIHAQGRDGERAAAGIQLAHAGAKASTQPWLPGHDGSSVPAAEGGWITESPSGINPVSHLADSTPMSLAHIQDSLQAWADAAARAHQAGFDVLQIHAAHGYLIHQFLSPLTNQRTDAYGGDLTGRTKYLRDVVAAVQTTWPADKPVMIRFSGSDWLENSWSIADTSAVLAQLPGIDMVDLSSGGIGDVYQGPKPGPGYQLELAARIKADHPQLFVSGVGGLTDPSHAEDALEEHGLDALSIGRAALRNPNFGVETAAALGVPLKDLPYAAPYWRATWPRN